MNGLGVALIPKAGFVRRVGEKGLALHQDYHQRLRTGHTPHTGASTGTMPKR